MLRRRFLLNGATFLATATTFENLGLAADKTAAGGLKTLGAPQAFDYARLKGLARSMADAPYKPPEGKIPPAIAKLDWDQWQSISFRQEHALWANDDLPFRVRFFHLGFRATKPVRMYEVQNGMSHEIAYDPALFDYGKSGLRPGDAPADLGFAGFNLLFHTDWVRDRAAFQGASYFRATDGSQQYGMSQRGLAVDTGMPDPEEFPDFIAYYLERPAKGSNTLILYGLLDSPSAAGAYRFVLSLDDTLLMDIDAAVYPRKQIERLGIAPGTSMFFYGKADRHLAIDWRPEIHDSDGLQMWTGAGEWIWRPLNNPHTVRVNSFADEQPRGFGLMQRERSFEAYEDDGVFYEKRPDVWVEPKGNWGKGSVMLVEIPTRDETSDNIVAFWTPADKPQRGQECLYSYRLYWTRNYPPSQPTGRVVATRSGIGGIIGRKQSHFSWRFVVDFSGGLLGSLGDRRQPEAVITVSRGRIETVSARPVVGTNDWRAMFDYVPTDDSTEPVNMRLYLSLDGAGLTETWLYQYEPPPPDQRKLLIRSA
jgi:periplasmic glucans biosynthesis protein